MTYLMVATVEGKNFTGYVPDEFSALMTEDGIKSPILLTVAYQWYDVEAALPIFLEAALPPVSVPLDEVIITDPLSLYLIPDDYWIKAGFRPGGS